MANKSKAQTWIEYAAVRSIFGFLGILPRRISIKLAQLFARLLLLLISNLRKTGIRNLEIAYPNLSSKQQAVMLRGTFNNLGRVLGELSQFPKSTKESLADLIEFQFSTEILRQYESLKSDGRGIIIISPHLGNWELLVYAWSALREPISYLARPLDNPLIERFTVDLRTKFENRPINKTNAVGLAIKILRDGGILGILADVNSHPKEGVFVPFFGIDACTSIGPAMLAMRTNSVILPMCGVWDETKGKYLALHGKIIEPPNTGERQNDIRETTALFTAEVEKLIRAYPEQWLWIHKRWKSRPPGEEELYG